MTKGVHWNFMFGNNSALQEILQMQQYLSYSVNDSNVSDGELKLLITEVLSNELCAY